MSFTAINPATEEFVAEFDAHSDEDVERALAHAATAFEAWRATSVSDRAHLMIRAAELLESEIPVVAELLTSEMGKTFTSAKGEVAKCAMTMRYYAEHAEAMLKDDNVSTSGSRSGIRYDPIGAVLAVMPWNYPLWQFIRVAAPTVMAGNVMVLKHASNVPGCAKFIEDLFTRSGFPKGVVTTLFVSHDQVPRIIADPRIAAVTLTGSDPFIVASSADMDATVPMAVTARLQNNGQSCIASKRFIVVRERADEFIERFVAAMAAVPTGDPMDPTTVLGPVVSRSQLDELTAQVADSVAQGAVALTGGTPLERRGYYFPATVLTNVPTGTRAGCEELFGPVAVVEVVEDLDAAIAFANDTPWGLGGAIHATDQKEIDAAIAGLDVGMVFANSIVASMPELPFGGTKDSGFGRELGEFGVREFTNVKTFFVA
jgi:succinate-semialdehyde dehydrogenase/glutarate-semialdehyde dehydrogenase